MLRARLIASGDLDAAEASDSLTYDAALETAVRSFQRRMGLQSDGVVGPGTIAELNVPLAERIRQLRVNLDRGRVLLQDLPDEFVIVNIAGFTAHLVRARQFVWTARVQVGKPYRRTPIFRSRAQLRGPQSHVDGSAGNHRERHPARGTARSGLDRAQGTEGTRCEWTRAGSPLDRLVAISTAATFLTRCDRIPGRRTRSVE